jgi:hypothetical protein
VGTDLWDSVSRLEKLVACLRLGGHYGMVIQLAKPTDMADIQ